MRNIKLHESDQHQFILLNESEPGEEDGIRSNQYLVVHEGQGVLLDPGGFGVMPRVLAEMLRYVQPADIKGVFLSHQDPDIISSLALWLEFKPDLKCYTSWLWSSFLPHFGGASETFVSIPDGGMTIKVGSLDLQAVPAHYLHSSGNFHLYDPKAKILFSGDVGAALLPPDNNGLYVEDFSRHIRHAEAFHKRWMGSDRAKRDWCERVARLEIDMLVPQHGAIYQGPDVQRFINWFAALEVGVLRP